MEQFYGTYRGFTPIAESPMGCGECEMVVGPDGVQIRIATGHSIATEQISADVLRVLSVDEIRKDFNDGTDITGVEGFIIGDGPVRVLRLAPVPEDNAFRIHVRGIPLSGELDDTVLFTPEQLARGMFDKAIAEIEREYGVGQIPLLKHGGMLLDPSQN